MHELDLSLVEPHRIVCSLHFIIDGVQAIMPLLSISGISVDFPKTPYKCQVDYMEHVLRALSTGANALLESPTGTGKTLCLLCATLAWQDSMRGKPMELAYSAGSSLDPTQKAGSGSNPRAATYTIVYATRTHSQLAQVVSELRETNYRPRMTVMGSREQLCVHEKVSKLKRTVLNHACNSLNSKRGCMYRNNLDNYIDSGASMDSSVVMDIEELVKLGNHRKICPYFHSREFSQSADLVLLPYNYLLDSSIRRTVKLDWSKCIIIFDEAHNLERVASDAASFSLSSTDLAMCIQEMQTVLTKLRDEQTNKTESEQQGKVNTAVLSGSNNGNSGLQRPSLAHAVNIAKALFKLEESIDNLQLSATTDAQPQSSSGGGGFGQQVKMPGLVHPGEWLGQLLVKCGLTHELYIEEMRKCCGLLMEIAEDAMSTENSSGASALAVEPKLQAFTVALERVFRSIRSGSVGDYRVYIADETIKYSANQYAQVTANGAPPPRKKRVVNYWCFSTGVAMQELQSLGVRSMLLTSGTLSPMVALREDIKLPFAVQLENPHVISENQMWVASISHGVGGKILNSSFQNRDTAEYKEALGQSVLQICLTMVGRGSAPPPPAVTDKGWEAYNVTVRRPEPAAPPVPVRGGVLVFFPSYAVMETTCACWKERGIYNKLESVVGSVLVEPKGSGAPSGEKSTDFASKGASTSAPARNFMTSGSAPKKGQPSDGDDEEGEDGAALRSIVGQFDHAIKTYGGCVLLAVCRGKVSEGIDFTDNKGRVVIITGIPYAPYMDPWVVLKKQYLDDRCAAATKPVATVPVPIPIIGALQQPAAQDIVSAFHRITPSAYPAVMPPAPPPPAPVPPALPAPAVVVVPASGAPKPQVAVTLSGQNWYTQSAARAVNQCVGRVIRHIKDWGTIFLLDDRFMQDRQIAQLSGWVKPRVKKYTDFDAALRSFRGFLTTAAQDKNLVSQAVQARQAEPQPDIENYRLREREMQRQREQQQQRPVARHVEIRASQLDDTEGDTNYINPSLLLSQQPQPLQRASSVGLPARSQHQERSEEDMLSIFQRPKSANSLEDKSSAPSVNRNATKPGSSSSSGGDLVSVLGRAREKAPVSSGSSKEVAPPPSRSLAPSAPAVTISYGSAPASTSSQQTAKPAGAPSFGLGAKPSASAFSVQKKPVYTSSSTIADYFAPPPSSQSGTSSQRPASQQSQRPAVDMPWLNKESRSISSVPSSSQRSAIQPRSYCEFLSQQEEQENTFSDPAAEFERCRDLLRGPLDKSARNELYGKVHALKSVKSISPLRQFLAECMTLLNGSGLKERERLEVLRSFAYKVPAELADEYNRLVGELRTATLAKKSSGSKVEAEEDQQERLAAQRNQLAVIRDVQQGLKRQSQELQLSQSTQLSQYSQFSQDDGMASSSQQAKRVRENKNFQAFQNQAAAKTSTSALLKSMLPPKPQSAGVVNTKAGLGLPSSKINLGDIALSSTAVRSNVGVGLSQGGSSNPYTCTVCYARKASVGAPCGHISCQQCWDGVHKGAASFPCPFCRKTVERSALKAFVVK